MKRHRGEAQPDVISSVNDNSTPVINGYGGRTMNDLDHPSSLPEWYQVGQKQSLDPYEFSEESSSNTDSFSKRRSLRHSRDDSFAKQSPFIKQVRKDISNPFYC